MTEQINCCPPATTAQVLKCILEALDRNGATNAAQKIAALEAAILLIEGDRHAAPLSVEARIGQSLKQWARSNEEARAGVAEAPPTLEQVIDDIIAAGDVTAAKRLWPDIEEQDIPTRMRLRLRAKLRVAFGAGSLHDTWVTANA